MTGRVIIRQFSTVFVGTAVVIFLLLRSGAVERVSYAIEKGRLRALSEAVPPVAVAEEADARNRVIAALLRPAVVNIETFQRVPHGFFVEGGSDRPSDDVRSRLRPNGLRSDAVEPGLITIQSGVGSGFIVDAEKGYIVTNQHVIAAASEIKVSLSDGREFEARVVAEDEATDLAILSIPAVRLFEVTFGDSRRVGVGDRVFALGNPFGLEGTFSSGIVSALGRSARIQNVSYTGFIQTDAVINPGNSGGPLVNRRGEVIGVNTAIATESGVFSGVGFAIPSSRVVALLPKLISGEKIVRGFLGIAALSIRDDRATAEGVGWSEDYGVIIKSVVVDSPAEYAGLEVDDVLIEVNGQRMQSFIEMMDAIALISPGTRVTLRYWRDGEYRESEAELVRRSDGL